MLLSHLFAIVANVNYCSFQSFQVWSTFLKQDLYRMNKKCTNKVQHENKTQAIKAQVGYKSWLNMNGSGNKIALAWYFNNLYSSYTWFTCLFPSHHFKWNNNVHVFWFAHNSTNSKHEICHHLITFFKNSGLSFVSQLGTSTHFGTGTLVPEPFCKSHSSVGTLPRMVGCKLPPFQSGWQPYFICTELNSNSLTVFFLELVDSLP